MHILKKRATQLEKKIYQDYVDKVVEDSKELILLSAYKRALPLKEQVEIKK